MKYRPWNVKRPVPAKVRGLAQAIGAPELLSGVLVARGWEDPAQAYQLLEENPPMSDPFLLKDMDRAVERIHRALEEEEPMVVFGDYDVDGITATALLFSHLRSMGANVRCKLPTREGEGYGLSRSVVDSLYKKGFKLIITVDNGISAVEEAAYAASLGMDLIITDHHLPAGKLPSAYAVVDPMRQDDTSPFKYLCGAGVAFKLCAALDGIEPQDLLEVCGDLAAIGTVADVMPLTGENRTLVKAGLEGIKNTDRPGLVALMEEAGLWDRPLGAESISFGLAPRLNAAGRMEDPSLALKLVLTEDPDQAAAMAQRLEALNAARQQAEQEIMAQAQAEMEQHPERLEDRVLVIWGEDYHPGVIGIVASRLVEKYNCPAIVITLKGGEGRGSGRSVPGFNLYDALDSCKDILIRFGGHALAAGLSVEPGQIETLRRRLDNWARTHQPAQLPPALELDCPARMSRVNLEEVRALDYLAPYGNGNPRPAFLLENAILEGVWPVSDGKHSRLRLTQDGVSFFGVWFGMAPQSLPYAPGDRVDAAVTFSVYQGKNGEMVSVRIRELRPAGLTNEHCTQTALFDAFRTGLPLTGEQRASLLPQRSETVALYRAIQTGSVRGEDLRPLFAAMGPDQAGKTLVSLTALEQSGLVACCQDNEGRQFWRVIPTREKKDLTTAPIFAGLQEKE